jgi:acyl-CoA thioesterase
MIVYIFNYELKSSNMNQFEKFQSAISITKIKDNFYKIIPNRDYFVGNTPHGGYLNAVMSKALLSTLPHKNIISSSTQYLDRTDSVDTFLEVEILRESRGSSAGLVKLIQDNKICSTMTGTCSDFKRMKGFHGLESRLPDIFNSHDHNEYMELNYDKISKGFTPAFIKQLDCKINPDHAWWDKDPLDNNAEARCSAFLEMPGGMADQFCLAYYSDILPPVVSNKYGALGWIPTLTLTTHIRMMPTTSKLFADFKASDINNGYFEQDARIWDLNGNFVASSRQLARILKSEEKLSLKRK